MLILFLKASGEQLGLLSEQVEVGGYTTKHGTYVAPHRAMRRKRAPQAAAPEKAGQGDLFSAPAAPKPAQADLFGHQQPQAARAPGNPPSAQERAPEPAAPSVPAAVLASLKRVLDRLRDIRSSIDQSAEGLDRKHGGDGRYEADVLRNRGDDIKSALERIEKFREIARAKGIDPDPVLAGLGGVPDFTPSPAASEWLSDKPKAAAAPTFEPTHELPDGTPVRATDEPGVYVDAAGDEWEDDDARPLPPKGATEKPKPKPQGKAKAALVTPPKQNLPTVEINGDTWYIVATGVQREDGKTYAHLSSATRGRPVKNGVQPLQMADYIDLPSIESAAPIVRFGVPAGTSKADRRRLNAEAVAILQSKADGDMTDADRALLAQYSGNGGCGDSLNEFYTDPDVARAMWSMLGGLGIVGGDFLEPSSGTGVYLHTAPAGSRVTAVELDPVSSRISSILHPGHESVSSSMEGFAATDGRQFDAVIGNVPFGPRGSLIKQDKPELATAEQYFLDTALDKTRDGGIVALIVPTGIMDGSNNRSFRERLLKKAEFLDAYRLPNTAFEHSHTGVTTDVVVFRKRPADAAGALSTLTRDQMRELGLWDSDFVAGTYFTGGDEGTGRGAANVFGRLEEGWRAKAGMGSDITVTGSMQGVAEALAQQRPQGLYATTPGMTAILASLPDEDARERARRAALTSNYRVAKVGDTKVVDGVLYVLQGEPPRWHRAEAEVSAAVIEAHAIAQALEKLGDGDKSRQDLNRAGLIEALDGYVATHGAPHRNRDLKAWLAQPTLWDESLGDAAALKRRMARLLGAVNSDGSYSDLITGRETERSENSLDTVATTMALEEGGFTADELAARWGRGSSEEVLDHLFASDAYAINADGKTWTTTDEYLSGDLWARYDAARVAIEHEGLSEVYRAKYRGQIDALEKAIDPQSLESVEVALNSGFVTPVVMSAWFESKRQAFIATNPGRSWTPDQVIVTYDSGLYRFSKEDGKESYDSDAKLLDKWLNRTGVRKDDLGAIERMNAQFREWLLTSEYRDQVEDRYNRTHRGFVPRAYSDAPIDIPGLAKDGINAYHYSGLRWALEAGKGIIADDVGLGKTARGLMLARLAKAEGRAKKPTFVVPKSVLANWMAEAEDWFPGSKVLVIGETYSNDKDGNLKSRADTADERRQKYHQLAQNDYDFVFISQPAWNDLDLDPVTKGEYVNDDFWTQRGDALGNAGDKRLNQIRTNYEQAVAKREFAQRQDTVYFGDTGIDMVIMDEGHAYKNLYAARSRFGESPKFLGGTGLSNRALDTQLKTRWVREHNDGRGVYMLTATPTKNSPLEVYSMLSHIAPEAFERMGIKNSEDFLDRFCVFENDTILTVDGKIEEALVTAGFKNLDELREVMKRYINRRTAEDVGLVLPEREDHQHLVEMSAQQKAVYSKLRELAAESKDKDDTGDAHIFSIMDKMGKAAIDLELLGPEHTGAASPKLSYAADMIARNAKDGGQVVFCDHVAVHEKMVNALVAAGVPRNQIGVVNAKVAASGAARQRISDQFNAGKLKVVIGNTATMGEGVNLQKGTTDIHHLDLTWEPASIQQRNGRGLRQGNKMEAVRIHTYIAKGSFDGYRWQTLRSKRDWQDLLWHGGDRVENLAREGKVSRDDMLIMLSADPDAARKQYEENKAAAKARADAAGQEAAGTAYVKFVQMSRNLGELKNRDSLSARRLEREVSKLRDRLAGDRHFHNKALLADGAGSAVLVPATGHVWTAGTGLEMDGTENQPVNWTSGQPSRWVVESADPVNGHVKVRQYGGDKTYTLTSAQLAKGVKPYEYREVDERRHYADKALDETLDGIVRRHRLKTAGTGIREAVAKARSIDNWAHNAKARDDMQRSVYDAILQGDNDIAVDDAKRIAGSVYRSVLFGDLGLGSPKNMGDMKGAPPEVVREHYGALQDHFKSNFRSYSDGWSGPVPLIKDGAPAVVVSYSARDAIEAGHDLMLPTPENREKAIQAYVDAESSRVVRNEYTTSRGRSTSHPVVRYAGFEYSNEGLRNPWHEALAMFGDDALTEAVERHAKAVNNAAAGASSLEAALDVVKGMAPTMGRDQHGRHSGIGPHIEKAWPALSKHALAGGADAVKMLLEKTPPAMKNKRVELIETAAREGHLPTAEALKMLADTGAWEGPDHRATFRMDRVAARALRRLIEEAGALEKTPSEVFGQRHTSQRWRMNEPIGPQLTGGE